MYALKVLDKAVLCSRSKRWQLHASRELECLISCDHPYIVNLAYSFQTPQYLYMVQARRRYWKRAQPEWASLTLLRLVSVHLRIEIAR